MIENGYIKLYRCLKKWGWYTDVPVKTLWVHLLLSANYEDGMFLGKTIQRGQLVCSYAKLSEESGLTVKQVRGALDKLRKTGEITVQSNRHYTVVTIVKFDEYQTDQWQTEGRPMADQWQTEGRQRADQWQTEGRPRATMEEEKEIKKARKQESKKRECATLTDEDRARFPKKLQSVLDDWMAYKHERCEDYQPTGLRNLLAEIEHRVSAAGEDAVCDVMRLSMASGWRGIVWDRLQKGKPTEPAQDAPLADWERDWLEETRRRQA